jgi:exo-rhamnogalacturonan lyase-like protein
MIKDTYSGVTLMHFNMLLKPLFICSTAIIIASCSGESGQPATTPIPSTGQTPSTTNDTSAPDVPVNLKLKDPAAFNNIVITWGASADNVKVTGYKVYRDNQFIANSNAIVYQDVNVTADTAYMYTVSAFDGASNESSKSTALSVRTAKANAPGGNDTTAPSAPTNLALNGASGSNYISIKWTASTDDFAVSGYKIYRDSLFVGVSTSTDYVDVNVQADTSYSYAVTAYDSSNNESAKSSSLSARTAVQPPNTVPVPNPGATSIPLTLKGQYSLLNQPLKTGIPFPIGKLLSTDNVRLETADGSQEYQAQVQALATWPDGSVKAALVQLMDSLPTTTRNYQLSFGSKVSRTDFGTSVKVTKGANTLSVDTGKIKFDLGNQSGLINALWRDANNDSIYQASEKSVQGSELYMVNAFDQLEYTSRDNAGTTVTVEEQGPVRAVILVKGALRNASNTTLMKYQLRYYAYLGSDQIDMDYTVIDDRMEANVNIEGPNLAISATSYGMRLNYIGTNTNPQYRFGGANDAVYSGAITAEHYLFQDGEFVFDSGSDLGHRFSYSGAGTGTDLTGMASGWMSVDTDNHHIVAMVRDFWQQYPNEMRVDNSTLTIALHPGRTNGGQVETQPVVQSGSRYQRPKTFYFNREGGAKTYQLKFTFPAGNVSDSTLNAQINQFNVHELSFMASLQWYVDSGVFGDMNVGTSTKASTGYDAYLMQSIYERSSRGDPTTAGRQVNAYGWRDFGDRLRLGWDGVKNGTRIATFYNDTHVGANNFFSVFLRTGDQRWFDLGEISTRHFMDIDVVHGPRKGKWRTPSASDPQPAGEIHAIKHSVEDHDSRNLHKGHAHVSGLSDLYLLTGDYRSKEVLLEITDWWAFMTPHFFKVPFNFNDTFREAERDFAWPLYVMTERTRVFNDVNYHKNVSAQLANYMIQWWQTPRQHIGYNPADGSIGGVVGTNDASKGTGYWTMTEMDNNGGNKGANGTNPWMAGPMLSNLITFYEQDKLYKANGNGANVNYTDLKDMLFQTMNYIVKYGYSSKGYFVYSEVSRGDGGYNHIVYGLAYLDRLYKTELAAQNIANPQWYDTQGSWNGIAQGAYDKFSNLKGGSNSQSYGFYGYEIVFPLDFFKIMSPK